MSGSLRVTAPRHVGCSPNRPMAAEQIAPGVFRLRTLTVNVYLVADGLSPTGWTLIDTGLPGYSAAIRREAARVFERAPSAILLTHGHFDHTGALAQLAAYRFTRIRWSSRI
jgi:glyoxylase-like metal-dependent hydrolase (beta-lactamase superfamily II)